MSVSDGVDAPPKVCLMTAERAGTGNELLSIWAFLARPRRT